MSRPSIDLDSERMTYYILEIINNSNEPFSTSEISRMVNEGFSRVRKRLELLKRSDKINGKKTGLRKCGTNIWWRKGLI